MNVIYAIVGSLFLGLISAFAFTCAMDFAISLDKWAMKSDDRVGRVLLGVFFVSWVLWYFPLLLLSR